MFIQQGKTNWKFLLIVVILAVIVGGGILWWQNFAIQKPIACTQEAKICPDGSAVGRTGPNCEFAECPAVADEIVGWNNYSNPEVKFTFKYPKDWEIAEDNFYMTASGIQSTDRIVILQKIGDNDSNNWIRINGRQFQCGQGKCQEVGGNIIGTYSQNSEVLDIFNKIISSFTIANADETADWQTYRNEEYGYEFQIPKNYQISDISKYPSTVSFGETSEHNFFITATEHPMSLGFHGTFGPILQSETEQEIISSEKIAVRGVVFNKNYWGSGPTKVSAYTTYNNKIYTILLGAENKDVEQKEKIFDQILSTFRFIDKNEASTKTYHSDKLGVEFTYDQTPTFFPGDSTIIKVAEVGNKIYVYDSNNTPESGQSIEVFQKDSKASLKEAIESKFLVGYDSKDCFVRIYTANEPIIADTNPELPNYIAAGISYPPSDDPNGPWWGNSKCPQQYSETNGVQYFLENKDVPTKFLFISVGQEILTTDGTSAPWGRSIRIIE